MSVLVSKIALVYSPSRSNRIVDTRSQGSGKISCFLLQRSTRATSDNEYVTATLIHVRLLESLEM